MELKDLEKKLENIKTPEIEIQSHKNRLKMALLSSGYFKEKTIMSLLNMSLLKKFAPVGAMAVIALLVVVGVNYFKNPSSVSNNNLSLTPTVVYAKELVVQAQKQLTEMKAGVAFPNPTTGIIEWKTPDADGNIRDEKGRILFTTTPEGKLVPVPREVPAISQTFTAKDFALSMEEAKQAKDLSYLGDKILPDGKRIKVLQFTDSKGNKTILGIDENKLPVIMFAYNEKKVNEEKVSGGVIFKIKNGNQPPSGEGIQHGKIDSNAPKPMDFEEMIKEWTEDLEQPTDFKTIQK